MKIGFSAGTFCQTLGVPDMLEDNICSHQTKLAMLSLKELTVLQNKYG